MNFLLLVKRSLVYYRRTHLGTLAGAITTSTILVGALVVGDSVRGSLKDRALARIGNIDAVMATSDRFFRAALADDLEVALPSATFAPVIALGGVATTTDNAVRANSVFVYGVDHRFFRLASGERSPPECGPGEVALNTALATRLRADVGSVIVLRVEQPSALSRDAVLARLDNSSLALRVTVSQIMDDGALGQFSLHASQLPPLNAFLSRAWLAEQIELSDRSNLLLASETSETEVLSAALQSVWSLADAELELRRNDARGYADLRSRRVFIDPAIERSLNQLTVPHLRILTYFASSIESKDRATPYSLVSAIGGSAMDLGGGARRALDSIDLRPTSRDGIVINDWLARDLGVAAGAPLTLSYISFDDKQQLVSRSNQFVVSGVVPIEGLAADRELMPDFPGIADAEHSRDWEPGIPIDFSRVRPEDEAYWDTYRGTPKAFIGLSVAQEFWGNRFGQLTAIRVPIERADAFGWALRDHIDPATVGLRFEQVRERAMRASVAANDFGTLFLGLSGFLIISAVLLTVLLFVFTVERRSREIGTLRAIGFRPAAVRRLLLAEAAILALVGCAVGAGLGLIYTRGVLALLTSIWADAAASAAIAFHATPLSIVGGAVAGVAMSVISTWLAIRHFSNRPVSDLLKELPSRGAPGAAASRRRLLGPGMILGVTAGIAGVGVAIVGLLVADASAAAGSFFASGSLLLVSSVLLAGVALGMLQRERSAGRLTTVRLGLRNASRRRGRSLATVTLLGCGTFLIIAVGLNRVDANARSTDRASGTGGFALFASSTVPLPRDPDTIAGRRFYGFDDSLRFVSMRVRPGDDASCLNIGSAQQPQLVGVDAEALAKRESFSFTTIEPGSTANNPWLLLQQPGSDDVVPAIGDHQSITWALHKTVGDTIEYTDESGRPFTVRIVATVSNSILQGNLFINKSQFEGRFPSQSGFRMFLIDASPDGLDTVESELSMRLADYGLEVSQAVDRLNQFNAVQNTYLAIFQALGGLGLLLGSAGLGVVVLRNVLERRRELAVLGALGFQRGEIRTLVMVEHVVLMTMGLVGGVISAVVAVVPALRTGSVGPTPILITLITVALIAIAGVIWIWLATVLSTRGHLIITLRHE